MMIVIEFAIGKDKMMDSLKKSLKTSSCLEELKRFNNFMTHAVHCIE